MKSMNVKLLFLTLAFFVINLYGSAPATYSDKKETALTEEKNKCTTLCTEDHVESAKVLFKKDKVYEIVFFSVTEGKEKQLFEKYMPKAAPFFKKYGVKNVAMFSVVENRSDDLQSKMVGIFEWPDYEAKEKLEADINFQKVAKLRDGTFSFFKGGWFATKEDKEVTFYSNKVYEMVGADIYPTDEAKNSLSEYFKVSEPIKRSYGGVYPEFVINFIPSDSKGTATYSPEMQFIVEWETIDDNRKLFANEDFKTKAVPLMQKAVAKANFVFAKFIFPTQK